MCVYARVHRCGCMHVYTGVCVCTSMQSPRLVPAIILHHSATKFTEQGLSTKRRAGSLLWGSHLHLRRPEFQVGICKGSRNPTYGSHTWVAQAEPPSPYLIKKKITLITWKRRGGRGACDRSQRTVSPPRGVGGRRGSKHLYLLSHVTVPKGGSCKM